MEVNQSRLIQDHLLDAQAQGSVVHLQQALRGTALVELLPPRQKVPVRHRTALTEHSVQGLDVLLEIWLIRILGHHWSVYSVPWGACRP